MPTSVPDAVLAQWDHLAAALAARPDDAYDLPTRLPGWRVAELVAHLAGTVDAVTAAVAAPAPAAATLTLATYYDRIADVAADVDRRAREGAAGRTPGELRVLLPAAVERAGEAVRAASPDRLVTVRRGTLRLADFLRTRAVEAVVHGLDLGVEPDRGALRLVVRFLAGTLAARAPGRSVEVRVPPYAAVQCVPGPRHTRGTPPNVVEADPVAFVEVTTGRVPWSEVVADGRVRASGERADLRPYLPLL